MKSGFCIATCFLVKLATDAAKPHRDNFEDRAERNCLFAVVASGDLCRPSDPYPAGRSLAPATARCRGLLTQPGNRRSASG
jgi:hypothetical protein